MDPAAEGAEMPAASVTVPVEKIVVGTPADLVPLLGVVPGKFQIIDLEKLQYISSPMFVSQEVTAVPRPPVVYIEASQGWVFHSNY